MESYEPYIRGSDSSGRPASVHSPGRRRHSSRNEPDPPEGSPRARRHSSRGFRHQSEPAVPAESPKRPKEEVAAQLAAAQVVVESKYKIPDSLRYKVGNLETKVKPRLNHEFRGYFEHNTTDPAVVNQRANLLSIVEPIVKVYGDPQRHPEDAAKDGRVLDGLRSWFEEAVLGQIRIRPNGRDIKTELLGRSEGAWRPTRLGFTLPLPTDGSEVGNEWFGAVWQDLYLRVSHFAELYFGEGLGFGEAVPNGGDIWRAQDVWDGIKGKNELVWLVSQVAKQDNAVSGGWDALLARAVQRKLTVVGMVGKLLQKWVFDELLFGADEIIGEILRAQDVGLVQVEGYRRKRGRAEAISAYFRDTDIPPQFWEEVDKRSITITMWLLPFFKLMDKNFNNSRAKSLQGFHQQIHDIVAQAGYLAVQMARSKDIFYFSAPFLGQAWDVDCNQVDDRIWAQSTDTVYRRDKRKEIEWEKKRNIYKLNPEAYLSESSIWDRVAELGFRGVLGAILGFIPNFLYKVPSYKTYPDLKGMPGVTDKDFKKPPHQGKVQIIVWPKCERYSLMGEIDPQLQTSRKGESITTLLPAQVAYYQGRTDEIGAAAEEVPTLFDWLDHKRKLVYKVWWDRLVKLALLLLVLAVLSYQFPLLWVVPKVCFALARLFVLVVLGAMIQILTLAIASVKFVLFVFSAVWNTLMSTLGLLSLLGLEFPDSSPGSWQSPSWGSKRFGWDSFTLPVPGFSLKIPGHEGKEHAYPWYHPANLLAKKREPDYLDELLGFDFENSQKELETEKKKARQRARERAKELERLQREKGLGEDEDGIEITKVVDFIRGPITPPPTSTKTKRMTLKRSWTRKGEEPGPEIWEEHTPGYIEILTEKAKEKFKDKTKEKFEEQKRLAEWRKAKAKQEPEKEGEEWKSFIKPDWYAWFGGATEEELRQQEEERLAFEAGQEAARSEKETKKERKKREKDEARLKKLKKLEAKEKKELEEIQGKERELELEMAKSRAEPRTAPRKVKPAFNKEVFEDWWKSTIGPLALGWQPLYTLHYPVLVHKDAEDSDKL